MKNKENVQAIVNRMHLNGEMVRKNNRQTIFQKRRRFTSIGKSLQPKYKQIPHQRFLSQNNQRQRQKYLKNSPHYTYILRKNNICISSIKLGSGGNGTVYKGINVLTNELVAVKVNKKKEEEQIKHLINLESSYVVKMHDFWFATKKDQVSSYIVLEYCEGNLKDEIKYSPLKKRLEYFTQVVEAYSYININKVVHRDLKLQNILVKDKRAKIADFGLAKKMKYNPLNDRYEIMGRRTGTFMTMAPQILRFKVKEVLYTQKNDIWAIGIILFQILYGFHPYQHCSALCRRVKTPRLYGKYDYIIEKCLIENEQERISWLQFENYYYNFEQTMKNHFKQVKERNSQMEEEQKQKESEKINGFEFSKQIINYVYYTDNNKEKGKDKHADQSNQQQDKNNKRILKTKGPNLFEILT